MAKRKEEKIKEEKKGKSFTKKVVIGLGVLILALGITWGYFENNQEQFFSILMGIVTKITQLANEELKYEGNIKIVQSEGYFKIWSEFIPQKTENEERGTVLLIMGACAQSILYSPDFYNHFLTSGYNVIRFDNRGTGLSSWGNFNHEKWTSTNLLIDTINVLNEWKVSKVHVFGVSMGGLIAQRLAIEYPDRIKSIAIASTWGGVFPTQYYTDKVRNWLSKIEPSSSLYTKFSAISEAATIFVGSRFPPNVTLHMEYETLGLIRGGNNPNCPHLRMLLEEPSRIESLRNVQIPSLIIHGDEDYFVNVKCGKELAETLPNSRLIIHQGIGHEIPFPMLSEYLNDIINFYNDNN